MMPPTAQSPHFSHIAGLHGIKKCRDMWNNHFSDFHEERPHDQREDDTSIEDDTPADENNSTYDSTSIEDGISASGGMVVGDGLYNDEGISADEGLDVIDLNGEHNRLDIDYNLGQDLDVVDLTGEDHGYDRDRAGERYRHDSDRHGEQGRWITDLTSAYDSSHDSDNDGDPYHENVDFNGGYDLQDSDHASEQGYKPVTTIHTANIKASKCCNCGQGFVDSPVQLQGCGCVRPHHSYSVFASTDSIARFSAKQAAKVAKHALLARLPASEGFNQPCNSMRQCRNARPA